MARFVGSLTAVLGLVSQLRVSHNKSYLVAADDDRVLGAVGQLAALAETAHLGRRLTEVDAALEHRLLRRCRRRVLERLQQLGTATF